MNPQPAPPPKPSNTATIIFAVGVPLALVVACVVITSIARLAPPQQTPNRLELNSPIPAVGATPLTPLINIPALVNKSSKEVDAVLGKPVGVVKTNDAGTTPGEFRDYKLEGSIVRNTDAGITARFYRNRAVSFMVDLPRETNSAAEALLLVGIDVQGTNPQFKSHLAERWGGTFGGVLFKDVTAWALSNRQGRYGTVQAEVHQ